MIQSRTQLDTALTSLRGNHPHMTPKQYKAALATLGMTQEGAARFFGSYPRAGQAWALGERPVPYLVGFCLEFMVKEKLVAEYVK